MSKYDSSKVSPGDLKDQPLLKLESSSMFGYGGPVTTMQFYTGDAEKAAAYLRAGGELLMRRWIAAACNYHKELNNALSLLSRAVAPEEGSIYGYNPVPALDMWSTHQNQLDSKLK